MFQTGKVWGIFMDRSVCHRSSQPASVSNTRTARLAEPYIMFLEMFGIHEYMHAITRAQNVTEERIPQVILFSYILDLTVPTYHG